MTDGCVIYFGWLSIGWPTCLEQEIMFAEHCNFRHNFYKDLPLYQHLLEFLNSDNETTASQSFTDVQQLE